jgi:hypothetical protein
VRAIHPPNTATGEQLLRLIAKQLHMAARDALDFDEIAVAKVFDPGGVERDHRQGALLVCSY